MTLARRLPDPRGPSQRAGHDAGWTAHDYTWLQDHDPHADWRSPAPDPTAEQAIARVERERKTRVVDKPPTRTNAGRLGWNS